jgi:hypothetical protein
MTTERDMLLNRRYSTFPVFALNSYTDVELLYMLGAAERICHQINNTRSVNTGLLSVSAIVRLGTQRQIVSSAVQLTPEYRKGLFPLGRSNVDLLFVVTPDNNRSRSEGFRNVYSIQIVKNQVVIRLALSENYAKADSLAKGLLAAVEDTVHTFVVGSFNSVRDHLSNSGSYVAPNALAAAMLKLLESAIRHISYVDSSKMYKNSTFETTLTFFDLLDVSTASEDLDTEVDSTDDLELDAISTQAQIAADRK